MIEILQNQWFWYGIGIALVYLGVRLMFPKKKELVKLEKEYYELVNSDKYKIGKGI